MLPIDAPLTSHLVGQNDRIPTAEIESPSELSLALILSNKTFLFGENFTNLVISNATSRGGSRDFKRGVLFLSNNHAHLIVRIVLIKDLTITFL